MLISPKLGGSLVTTAWRVLSLRMEGDPSGLSPWNGASSICEWREVLRVLRVAANILNKQSLTADKERSSRLAVGRWADNLSP
jgi:hypothetical protein